jgi:predicted ATPase
MIASFTLKSGRTPAGLPATINATPITVFVGPNNSGKSRILQEISNYCQNGMKNLAFLVLDELEFTSSNTEQIQDMIRRIQQPPGPNEIHHPGAIFIGGRHGREQINLEMLTRCMQNPNEDSYNFCSRFLKYVTIYLDGRSRINLLNQQVLGDLQRPPANSLQLLFRDDQKRNEVRRIAYEAFDRYFVLDPTNPGYIRVRLANRAPHDDLEERGLHEKAINYHASAQLIDETSDGVKAFTGILAELIAGDPSIVLIDEPEAFLHPSLAVKLGQEVSRAAMIANKRVFAATHSPQFLMGCVLSGAPINIVRLTYRHGVATSRVLPSNEVLELMRHPLLRSTGLLSGLFYEFVVVTEADTDRAFYQEVNERLLQFKPEFAIPNCLFINAQNKQTIRTLLRPLRKLGIPAVGILDVDVLKDGGTDWSELLKSAELPELLRSSLATLRASIKQAMLATGKDMKKDGGLAILEPSEKQAAESLLSQLSDYGLFVVPAGELESWLKALEIQGKSTEWLIKIFEKMGEDPTSLTYVRPAADDVWAFLGHIRNWMTNPIRKGIPE